jgi:hypothetical protein
LQVEEVVPSLAVLEVKLIKQEALDTMLLLVVLQEQQAALAVMADLVMALVVAVMVHQVMVALAVMVLQAEAVDREIPTAA